jgi:hypothetical protein
VLDDPRDSGAYRTSILLLGLALIAAVLGMCWIVVERKSASEFPLEMWFVPAALGGVFVGALIPFSADRRRASGSGHSCPRPAWAAIIGAGLLAVAALATGVLGAAMEHWALVGLGVALGGVFFGLLVPAPGRRDP